MSFSSILLSEWISLTVVKPTVALRCGLPEAVDAGVTTPGSPAVFEFCVDEVGDVLLLDCLLMSYLYLRRWGVRNTI